MAVFNNILAGAAGSGGAAGYEITRSLRFNSADTAYLNRTPSSAGNRKTWTWSGWIKKTADAGSPDDALFTAGTAGATQNRFIIKFSTGDQSLEIGQDVGGSFTLFRKTSQVFRDYSSWGHLVVAFDSTDSTANDRLKIYWNGSQITQFATNNTITQNLDTFVNNTGAHYICDDVGNYHGNLDAYLADIHFIDGQALAPTDFGETDDNGVWQPIDYTFATNPNNGTTWSGQVSGSIYSGKPKTNAFNGTKTYTDTAAAANNSTLTFTPSPAFSSATKVKIWVRKDSGTSADILLNGSSIASSITGLNSTNNYFGAFEFTVSGFTSLEWGTDSSNAWFAIAAIEVDGYTLLDGADDNSFHLDFSDNSSNAALGTDTSGNSNTWTVNNLSVAAGVGNDSLRDSPSQIADQTDTGAGGEVVGNYATWNPLVQSSSTFSNGNLQVTTSGGSGYPLDMANFYTPAGTGKWYWEFELDALSGTNYTMVGMLPRDSDYQQGVSNIPQEKGGISVYVGYNGSVTAASGAATAGTATATFAVGDILGWAFDAENGTVKCYKNGVAQGTQFTNVRTDVGWAFCVTDYDNSATATYIINFGQRPFAYTPPTGYVSLCTTNLPDPTIADGSTAMDVALWTGNGSTAQTIYTPNLSPDMVWHKERSSTSSHVIVDAVRGSTNAAKVIYPDRTDAEVTANSTQSITSLNSDGFTIGSTDNAINESGQTYVGWAWDAGSSTVSNTDGSITSSVRANASAGFSIVSYTGNGSAASVGHGLNATPGFYFIKNRSSAVRWAVYHTSIGPDGNVFLNETGGVATNSGVNGTSGPDSSVFYLKTSYGEYNTNGDNYIAYCFTPVEGYSAFGSYTGNGSTDGPFIYTGHLPRFVIIKRTDTSGNDWQLYDTARSTFNEMDDKLKANSNAAEIVEHPIDFLSNGFKPRNIANGSNGSGATYIYASFASNPFKAARAR